MPSNESQDTRGLLERSIAGDTAAFTRLVERHIVRLRLLLKRHGGAAGDADEDDLAQRVLEVAWSRMRTFDWRGKGSFQAWLSAIARNVAADRRKHLAADRTARGPSPDDPSGPGWAVFDSATSVSRAAGRREEIERVHAALLRLSDADRVVVERHLLDDLSITDLAADLGVSRATAWRRLHQALARLRSELDLPSNGGG